MKKTQKWGLKICRNDSGTDLHPKAPNRQLSSPPRASSPYMSSTSSDETSSTNSDFSGYISSETPPPEIKKGPYLKKSQAKQSNSGEGAETHQARFPTPQHFTGEGAETHQARFPTPQHFTGEGAETHQARSTPQVITGEGAETHQAMFPTPQVIIGEGVDTHLARSTSPQLTVDLSNKAKMKDKQQQAKAKIANQKSVPECQTTLGEGAETQLARPPTPQLTIGEGADTQLARPPNLLSVSSISKTCLNQPGTPREVPSTFSVKEVPKLLENTPNKSKVSLSPSSSNLSTHVNPDKEVPEVSEHFSSITASSTAQHSNPAAPNKKGKFLEESSRTEKDLVQNPVVLPYEGSRPSGPQKSLQTK